jgi:hypothetical protein
MIRRRLKIQESLVQNLGLNFPEVKRRPLKRTPASGRKIGAFSDRGAIVGTLAVLRMG